MVSYLAFRSEIALLREINMCFRLSLPALDLGKGGGGDATKTGKTAWHIRLTYMSGSVSDTAAGWSG